MRPKSWSAACGRMILAAAAVSCLGACVTTPQTIYRIGEDGEAVPHKRYARNVSVDFVHRFRNRAYRAAGGADFAGHLSAEQEAVLAEWGQPEMIRRPFKSRGNELVEEWAYLSQARIVQFVEGKVAFEGPLTDHERVLIERGYPNRASEVSREGAGEWVHWIYEDLTQLKGTEIVFSNDAIIYQVEHD